MAEASRGRVTITLGRSGQVLFYLLNFLGFVVRAFLYTSYDGSTVCICVPFLL